MASGRLDYVSQRQKVLIGSCAVQIAFGMREKLLESFRTICVYDEDYTSPITKKKHKGEVNPKKGIIRLSWKSFEEGYYNYTSGLNVGLHEMAHALKFENIKESPSEYLFLDKNGMRQYDLIASQVFKEINDGNHQFLRPYAGTNAEEFFAVCVEYFFEKSLEFQQNEPKSYRALTHLLRQDLLRML